MKLLTFSHQKKVDRLEVLYDDDDDIAMKWILVTDCDSWCDTDDYDDVFYSLCI